MPQSTCKICNGLKQRLIDQSDATLQFESPLQVLCQMAERCGGVCALLLHGVVEMISPEDKARTKAVLLAGGRGSRSLLRISGASMDYEDFTFNLEFYISKNCDSWPEALFLEGRNFPQTASDLTCMTQMSQWLEDCTSYHPHCRTLMPVPSSELRMLDLSSSTRSDLASIRLVEGVKLTTRFAALSHCWGMTQHLVTTKSSFDEHKRGISLKSLAKTFQDAITICRFLGIYYLWIDCLCILQDDEKDWKKESQKMGHLYQYAYLVISADAAVDGSVGCFTQRDVSRCFESQTARGSDSLVQLHARPVIEHSQYANTLADHEYRDPLSYRAWVLQEWLLATRTLHFTRQELVWDCRTSFCCECGGFNRLAAESASTSHSIALNVRGLRGEVSTCLDRDTSRSMTTAARLNLWFDVVEEYTTRRLTKPSDRMVAISGLASEIAASDSGLGNYTFGLFHYRFLEQLLWSRYAIDEPPERRTNHESAPSWSWGSIHQPVSWDERSWLNSGKFSENASALTSVSLGSEGNDLSRQSTNDVLFVTAPCVEGIIPRETCLAYGQGIVQLRGTTIEDIREAFFSIDIDLSEELRKGHLEVLGVKILETHPDGEQGHNCGSLILMRSANNLNQWTRIGSDADQIPVEWYSGVEIRTLVIL
ncbi:hypothetical protein MMC17_007167 [Xylographa soralifera]|nr:hypothetical protein [Xylographa soralifera]